MTWALAVHGGAGVIERAHLSAEDEVEIRAGLQAALAAGQAVLAAGGSALTAVEISVAVLEEHPHFNAGYGAALAADGSHELDASIMDGRLGRAGAVAGVRHTRSPVRLARLVLEQSPHVLLVGAGADAFARDRGLEAVENGVFTTPLRQAQWAEALAQGEAAHATPMKFGTVGAVARDLAGDLAAATSTGGTTAKRWGRVGDSPIVGAGTYAQNGVCAVSCTGHGEYFLRACAAYDVAARVKYGGARLEEAIVAVIQQRLPALSAADGVVGGGAGGMIALGPVGGADADPCWTFSTPGMYRGLVTASGLYRMGLYGEDES